MNIVEALSGDWWDGPMTPESDPDEPEHVVNAARVVLRLVSELLANHPQFLTTLEEKAAFDYLADYAGATWTLPPTTPP